MSRKARDKELRLGLKFSVLMKQSLCTTTSETFLYSLLKVKQEKKKKEKKTWRIICLKNKKREKKNPSDYRSQRLNMNT